jgi:general secretion pathway protein C
MTTEANWSDFASMDGDRMVSAANQLLPRWIALVLVVGIAWQLAAVIWLLMPGSQISDRLITPPTQIARTANSGTTSIDAQLIANTHLFGEADPAEVVATVPQESHENLAETRLNLSLKGTIASLEESTSIAIIADNRNEEKNYSIKDTVAPGATLHAIYADRVVLNRGGTLEVLKLPKEFPAGAAPIRRNTNTVARAATNNQSIQNVINENVSKLADVIRPTPYYKSGQMQGFRVYPGRDRKQFAALGLRPGDLIKDIDGAALTNPAQAIQIFQGLGDKDQVSVTVERNGKPEVIILSTAQLDLDSKQ